MVWYRPNEVNRMISVSGVLRKMVTYATAIARAMGIGETRIAAMSVPIRSAPIAERTVSLIVMMNASTS